MCLQEADTICSLRTRERRTRTRSRITELAKEDEDKIPSSCDPAAVGGPGELGSRRRTQSLLQSARTDQARVFATRSRVLELIAEFDAARRRDLVGVARATLGSLRPFRCCAALPRTSRPFRTRLMTEFPPSESPTCILSFAPRATRFLASSLDGRGTSSPPFRTSTHTPQGCCARFVSGLQRRPSSSLVRACAL